MFLAYISFFSNYLLEHLTENYDLVGGGYTLSETNVIVFSTIHPHVLCDIVIVWYCYMCIHQLIISLPRYICVVLVFGTFFGVISQV